MDSAYAGYLFTRKSHSGYIVMAAGAAIDWCSWKQSLLTTTLTEAEYVAMTHLTKEAMWISWLLSDLGMKSSPPMRIYADNQSSIILAESERLSNHTKHLDPQYHFSRQEIKHGTVEFHWIPSLKNAADCRTKPLGPCVVTQQTINNKSYNYCRNYSISPEVIRDTFGSRDLGAKVVTFAYVRWGQ
jgi:hypothetical protein